MSDSVKDLLQDINIQDTDYAPAGDMFEVTVHGFTGSGFKGSEVVVSSQTRLSSVGQV